MELFDRQRSKNEEKHKRRGLRDHKRRFGLRGREFVKRRYLRERLRDQYEEVQIKPNNGRDHIDTPPSACKAKLVQREQRDRQNDERDDADDVRRQNVIGRQSESRGACGDRGREEKSRPAAEAARGEKPEEHHDET